MKITDCVVYQYTIALKQPLVIHGVQINTRRGMVLVLRSSTGEEGFGEIAPLPALNNESFEFAQRQAMTLRDFLLRSPIPTGVEHLNGGFSSWLKDLKLVSSVQFGLEMAVLTLLANVKKVPVHKLISHNFREQVRLTGLLMGDKKTVLEEGRRMLDDGFINLKLKVGGNLDEEIDKVIAANELIDGKALLHLDANQSWDLSMAVKFGEEVGCAATDYIEEPFKDVTLIPEFFMKTTIPVALDESLQKISFDEAKSIEGVDVLVLKPTALGGIEKVWQISHNAEKYAINTVISSSFESDLGILMLANLAGGCTARDRAAGLDTTKWFGDHILKHPLEIKYGNISIKQRTITRESINFNRLIEIA